MSAPKQGQNFQLKQTQTLAVTPQMTQRLHILQCNQQQLEMEVQQMLDKNIMLELPTEIDFDRGIEQLDPSDIDSLPDDLSTTTDADMEWEDIYDTDYLESFDDRQKKMDVSDFQADWVSDNVSFDARIEQAIYLSQLSDSEKQLANEVLALLDADYFLTEPLEKLAKSLRCKLSELHHVVDVIRHLDPPGVASANVRECLLAQLQSADIENADREAIVNAHEILQDYYDYIDKKPEFICRRLNISEADYHEAMQVIRGLSPYPNPVELSTVQTIKPEVYVHQRMGMFYASPNADMRFDLEINKVYADLSKDCKGDEKYFMKSQLQEAQFFIDAINQRQKTVVRVANAIVMEQQEYFIHGAKAMRPLVMREIAEQLDLSESTISRAVSGKYLSFNQRLIEFKYFFAQGLSTTDDEIGEALSDEGATSATAAKEHIREIIDNEPPKKPLSDSKIEALLKERGIEISRRTVTKYREALGIPKTSMRKRLR